MVAMHRSKRGLDCSSLDYVRKQPALVPPRGLLSKSGLGADFRSAILSAAPTPRNLTPPQGKPATDI